MIDLSEEQRLILETVRRIRADVVEPLAAELDQQSRFPAEALEVFADNGLLNPLLPASHGGLDAGLFTTVLVLEEIATACAATALLIIAQTDGMLPILHGGSDALKSRFLSRLAGESRQLTALAATEPGAGSDLLSMKTRAVRDGDGYVVNGQKCFITNGSVADFFVLYAITDADAGARGISAFVVERGTPGLTYGKNENKMGMRGSINSELFFDEMRIPADQRIGEEGGGFANLMKTLSMNRLFCAAQAVGIAQGALDQATAFARERIQFGQPIAHLSPIQFMIADMATATEAARLLTQRAARDFDRGDAKGGTLRGGMAKVLASDTAMSVTTDAVQVMGGYGYMQDFPVERMMRDAKLTQIYTGTNQIARMVTGRAILLPRP
jgi:alkylation response protein AidB-like acyl-CoA dehydrogenase